LKILSLKVLRLDRPEVPKILGPNLAPKARFDLQLWRKMNSFFIKIANIKNTQTLENNYLQIIIISQ